MIQAATNVKLRLRADLRTALKERRLREARLIRALLAAIDNAEAPRLESVEAAAEQHLVSGRSADIERLDLSPAQVQAALLVEIEERETAAAEMERLDKPDHAEAMRAEALLARRYVT